MPYFWKILEPTELDASMVYYGTAQGSTTSSMQKTQKYAGSRRYEAVFVHIFYTFDAWKVSFAKRDSIVNYRGS